MQYIYFLLVKNSFFEISFKKKSLRVNSFLFFVDLVITKDFSYCVLFMITLLASKWLSSASPDAYNIACVPIIIIISIVLWPILLLSIFLLFFNFQKSVHVITTTSIIHINISAAERNRSYFFQKCIIMSLSKNPFWWLSCQSCRFKMNASVSRKCERNEKNFCSTPYDASTT